ncbi:MAG: DUF1963 domain-containing protein [Phycisphaerales bacterium]
MRAKLQPSLSRRAERFFGGQVAADWPKSCLKHPLIRLCSRRRELQRNYIEGLRHIAGGLLGVGLIWLVLSVPKPGMNALNAALPDWIVNIEAGFALTVSSALTLWFANNFKQKTLRGVTNKPQTRQALSGPDAGARWDAVTDKQRQGRDHHIAPQQERFALRPCWPQRRTQSWVGGLPMLPTDVEWPSHDGQPATFLAQLSLADLPDHLWHGIGPRSGWLVFWLGDRADRTVVLHVDGPVETRPQPDGVTPEWHWNMAPTGMHAALGAPAGVPARWFLEKVEGPVLGAVEDMASENPDFYDEEKGAWIWEPSWIRNRQPLMEQVSLHEDIRHGVDWPSLYGMLGVWRDKALNLKRQFQNTLENRDQSLGTLREPFLKKLKLLEENPWAEPDSFQKVRDELAAQEARFKARIEQAAQNKRKIENALDLSDEVEAELRAVDADTPFAREIGKEALGVLNEAYPVTGPTLCRENQLFMENYARYLYAANPATVPDALYELFAPLWEVQCRETLIFVGRNSEERTGLQGYARLIDLPPNPLAGYTFGDENRFTVDIRLSDLAEDNWSRTIADIYVG